MNIQVRVLSRNAQAEIKALRAQVAALEGQVAAANKTAAAGAASGIGGSKAVQSLGKWGNQLQWTGRQLQYNWTLPILLAAGAATKFQLDNEKAFTHVRKVYGDTTAATKYWEKQGLSADQARAKSTRVFNDELDALQKTFVQMSNYYGIAQKDILDVAGAWAQAGASGKALAEGVNLTMQASLIGDMDATKAATALISIQSQYGLNSAGLAKTLAYLNAIENQTAIGMGDLIDGFQRTAGVAREAGIDTRHLGAMLASLVPAAGSASQAGNALKTIITRLMSPTEEAAQVMNAMGLQVKSSTWQSATAMERLRMTSEKFAHGMTDSQKQVAATVLGSRWQVNKFLILMRDINSETGRYSQALDATSSKTKAFATMNRELNAILSSNPKRLQIIWETMKNGMADAIQPMIPYLLYFANLIRSLVTHFNNLNPAVQKMILIMLLLLAAVGPVVRYFGSLATLFATVGHAATWLAGRFAFLFTSEVAAAGGGTIMQAGLLKNMATWAAYPFRKIAAGFGAIAGATMAMGRVLGINAALGTVWMRAWMTVRTLWFDLWSTMLLAQQAFTARFVAWAGASTLVGAVGAMFTRMYAFMILESLTGWAVIRGVFAAGGARAALAAASMTRIIGTTQLIFAAVGLAVKEAMFNVGFIIYRAGALIPAAWAAMSTSLMRITVILQAEMAAAWSLMTSGIVAIYGAGQLALTRIAMVGGAALTAATRATGTALITLWALIQRGITAVVVAGRAATIAAWAGLQAGMALISRAFWIAIIRIWIAGAMALPRMLLAIRGALTTAWAVIIAIQRTGALAAAAASAGPWVAAFLAIVGVIAIFHKQIGQMWSHLVAYFSNSSNQMTQSLIKAWNLLPQGIQNALAAVVRIVRAAAMAVYSWFSYLNPFAHHSPSLVENVRKGMDAVGKSFGTVKKVQGPIKAAYNTMKQFGRAVASMESASRRYDQAQQRASIRKFSPGALGSYNAMAASVNRLTPIMNRYSAAIKAQQAVIDTWKNKLDAANNRLDAQQKVLDKLKDTASHYSDNLSAAQDRLSTFSSTPIKGMQAMNDAIHANDMAQKKLQWDMMQMSKVTGTLDQVKSKIEAINGAQELLRGEQTGLREAGAGSDILSAYDDQIKKLDKTKDSYSSNLDAVSRMQKQLDALQAKADSLDLQKSLKFDDLTYQIEKASQTMKEMPFDQIMAGVRGAQSDIVTWQGKLNGANAAVARQQSVVDGLTAARDRTSAALDREQNKLDSIQKKYDEVSGVIGDMQSAMDAAAQAAQNLQSKQDAIKDAKKKKKDAAKKKKDPKGPKPYVTPGLQNFRDAAKGNFPVQPDRTQFRKNFQSQAGDISKLGNDLAAKTAKMFGSISPFGPIKKKWNDFKAWLSREWAVLKPGLVNMFRNVFGGVDFGGGNISKSVDNIRGHLAALGGWLSKWGHRLAALFGPSFRKLWTQIADAFGRMMDQIGPQLREFGQSMKPAGRALSYLWAIVKPILGLIMAIFLLLGKVILDVIVNTIGPAIDLFTGILVGVIKIVRGVFEILVGLFSGNFGLMAKGIKDIFSGLVGGIIGIFANLGKIMAGIVSGIVKGIVGFFQWLYDVLIGHSIIPDLINGVLRWFRKLGSLGKWVWNHSLGPVVNKFRDAWKAIKKGVGYWWTGVKIELAGMKKFGTWLWNHSLGAAWNMVRSLWTKHLRGFFTNLWPNIRSALSGIKNFETWLWKHSLGPAWTTVQHFWSKHLRGFFSGLWGNVQKQIAGLKNLGSWFSKHLVTPAMNTIRGFLGRGGTLRTAFRKAVDAVGQIWHDLRELAAKPVRFLIDTVYTKGIRRVVNHIPGVKDLPPVKSNFKAGGVLPGYTPGSDVHTFHSNTAGTLKLSGGEAIMRPEWTRAVGGARAVAAMNKAAISGQKMTQLQHGAQDARYKSGGVFWPTVGRRVSTYPGHDGIDINQPPGPNFGAPIYAYRSGHIDYAGWGKGYGHAIFESVPGYGQVVYGHGSKVNVRTGQNVKGGQQIGNVGSTGNSSGPHLHFGHPGGTSAQARALLRGAGKASGGSGIGGFITKLISHVNPLKWLHLSDWKDKLGKMGGWGDLIKNATGNVVPKAKSWAVDKIKGAYTGVKGLLKSGATTFTSTIKSWVGGLFGGGSGDTASQKDAKKYAKSHLKNYGWSGDQWNALDNLWRLESGWRVHADNPTSSAYGIPQALPGSKMRSAGSDWHDNAATQIRWGMSYIKSVYGNPSHALTKWYSRHPHWYAGGGVLPDMGSLPALKDGGIIRHRAGGILARIGEGGRDEAVTPLPNGWRNDSIMNTGTKKIEMHFHGDLSFPNITDPADADTFINNLEILAKD